MQTLIAIEIGNVIIIVFPLSASPPHRGRCWIPPGSFCAGSPNRETELTAKQLTAMRHFKRIGEKLAVEHPEIAELYADLTVPFVAREVAERLIPEECRISQSVAAVAVCHAIRLLLSPEERARILHERKSLLWKKRWGHFKSEAWKAHCKAAGIERHKPGGPGVDVKALLDGRGRVAWTSDEELFLKMFVLDSAYQTGLYSGPDYVRIAAELNALFHEGKPVRYENSCRSQVADFRRNVKPLDWMKPELILKKDFFVPMGASVAIPLLVLAKNVEPRLPGFVGFNRGTMYISEEVPHEFRRFFLYHEWVEFSLLAGQEGRCLAALHRELELVPARMKGQYVEYRRGFFRDLARYCLETNQAELFKEIKPSLEWLES